MPDPTATKKRTVQRELDVVAVDDDDTVLAVGTCKWTRAKVARRDVEKALEIARHLSPDRAAPLYVYSRTGIAHGAAPLAESHVIHDVGPNQLLEIVPS